MGQKAAGVPSGRAEAFVAAASAAWRWFQASSPEALSAARAARLRAREKDGTGELGASGALREAVEQTVSAVCEAVRWEVGSDGGLADAAGALADAARALARASSASGAVRAEALVEAKRLAAEVERLRRAVRAESHEGPSFVAGIKRGEVALRLSSAAEAAQQACDALAESLAG